MASAVFVANGSPQESHRTARVLHVLEATLGGTLRYLQDIIDSSVGLALDMGWTYSTLRASSELGPALAKATSAGWNTFQLDMCRSVSPRSDVQSVWSLRRIIDIYRPHVLHCHSSKAGAIGRLALVGRRNRPKVVYSPHAIAANLGRRYLYAELALGYLTDHFVAVSESERQELIGYGIGTPDTVSTIAPGIDGVYYRTQDRSNARRNLGISQTAPLVVGVGRLATQKDPIAFVRVIQKLSTYVPDVNGIWVGDGDLRGEVENEIQSLNLQTRVTVAGWQRDVRPYLAASNMLLSTSQYESFGYMVAEALAMQRPVVATKVGGTEDIMKGELSHYLYKCGEYDKAALLSALMLGNTGLAERVGCSGRRVIEESFSPSRMRKALYDRYDAMLRTNHNGMLLKGMQA